MIRLPFRTVRQLPLGMKRHEAGFMWHPKLGAMLGYWAPVTEPLDAPFVPTTQIRGSTHIRPTRRLHVLILAAAASLALAACDNRGSQAEGYLIAQGHPNPMAHTTPSEELDRRACGGDGAMLYAWVADNGSGVVCSGRGKVWAPR